MKLGIRASALLASQLRLRASNLLLNQSASEHCYATDGVINESSLRYVRLHRIVPLLISRTIIRYLESRCRAAILANINADPRGATTYGSVRYRLRSRRVDAATARRTERGKESTP